jgi:hypothetical protein
MENRSVQHGFPYRRRGRSGSPEKNQSAQGFQKSAKGIKPHCMAKPRFEQSGVFLCRPGGIPRSIPLNFQVLSLTFLLTNL